MSQLVRPTAAHLKAVRALESALDQARAKGIRLEINDSLYELQRQGTWFIFARLNKKRTKKRVALFDSLWEVYQSAIAGGTWRILPTE